MKDAAGFYRKSAAVQMQRKYLHGREPETQKDEKRRAATGNVVIMCMLSALNADFDMGAARLERIAQQAAGVADRFNEQKAAASWTKAKAALNAEVAPYLREPFLLPPISAPRSRRERDELGEQRDAADLVVKFYAVALHKHEGFGPGRIAQFVKATEREYRAFGEYAKDGDYYGYQKLAQRIGKIFNTEMTVDESDTPAPFFGRTLD